MKVEESRTGVTDGLEKSRSQPPSILVAVASYGRAQDHYLEQVLAEYRKLRRRCRVVVLSNLDKVVQGAEVVVGLPSRDPYSLPFAHRRLFAENVEQYELFIYAEDDTLITEEQIDSFLTLEANLKDDEVIGFIRSETNPEGNRVITSIHHHFRWLPETVVTRGGELYARLSNEHSGCFIATKQHLRKAIASGGFLVEPHRGRYGMLESAASDIYTQCGLKRLICLSRIQEFIVPHLANKYYPQMGIPVGELLCQVQMLAEVYQTKRWNGSLFNPQTNVPGFRWSKGLYERRDEELLRTVPPSTEKLLSVGCGWGENEVWLSRKGIDVCAVPVDAVFAGALRRRGIRTVEGPFEQVVENLHGQQFDVVLMAEVLHLVKDPEGWLEAIRRLLLPDGSLIVSVHNTTDILSWIRDRWIGLRRPLSPDYKTSGVQPVSVRSLRRWFRSSGLELMEITPLVEGRRSFAREVGLKTLERALAERFILKAKRTR